MSTVEKSQMTFNCRESAWISPNTKEVQIRVASAFKQDISYVAWKG